MAQTPQGKVTAQVVKLLKEYGIWYFFPGNNGFGKSGIPDIVCCVHGCFVGIEVKSGPKRQPTPLQLKCAGEIRASGGWWFLVYDAITLTELAAFLITKQAQHRLGKPAW